MRSLLCLCCTSRRAWIDFLRPLTAQLGYSTSRFHRRRFHRVPWDCSADTFSSSFTVRFPAMVKNIVVLLRFASQGPQLNRVPLSHLLRTRNRVHADLKEHAAPAVFCSQRPNRPACVEVHFRQFSKSVPSSRFAGSVLAPHAGFPSIGGGHTGLPLPNPAPVRIPRFPEHAKGP